MSPLVDWSVSLIRRSYNEIEPQKQLYGVLDGRCMFKERYKLVYFGLNRVVGLSPLKYQRRLLRLASGNLGLLLLILTPAVTRCQDKAVSLEAPRADVGSQKPRYIMPLYISTNRMLVMLRVGGMGPFPVVFDTGTDGNVLDLNLSNKLALPHSGPSQSIDGTGTHVPGYETFIKGATVSGVMLLDGRATVAPYDLPDEVGIFGPNSFSGKLIRVEGTKNRVVVVPKNSGTIPHCTANPYVEVDGGLLPSVKLTIDGRSYVAEVDTGNNSALDLPSSLIPSLALQSPPVKIGTSVGASGTQDVYRGILTGSLKIGGVSQDSRRQVNFLSHTIPNVGLQILRGTTLVLDPAERRDWLFFDDAGEAACAATVLSDQKSSDK